MRWPVLFPHRRFLSELDHAAVVAAIARAEAGTTGEIRVFVTRRRTPDVVATAQRKFADLGMEKTETRNGVLLFVAPASRTFALVGDAGIHEKVGDAGWRAIVDRVAACFAAGDYHSGIVHAVGEVGLRLAEHFPLPAGAANRNELPDAVEEDAAPLIVPPRAVPRSFFPALFLALAGAWIGLGFLIPHADASARGFLLCRTGGNADCTALFHGEWKAWLPFVGLGGYLLEAGLLLAAYGVPARTALLLRLLRGVAAAGALLSLGLVAAQIALLHGLCGRRLLSTAVSVALAVVLHGLPAATAAEIPRRAALGIAACLGLVAAAVVSLVPGPLLAVADGLPVTAADREAALRPRVEPYRNLIRGLEDEWLEQTLSRAAHAVRLRTLPPRAAAPATDAGPALAIPLDDAQVLGRADAPVRLVVFSDFACGYCAALAPVLEQALRDYPGKVSLAWKDFPLPEHPGAFEAARAARCAAAQGLFWPFHDALYREGVPLSPEKLAGIAAALGLDAARFADDYRKGKPDAALRASVESARKLGIDGAPALYLNGRPIGGMIDYPDLRRKIDAALASGSRAGGNESSSSPWRW